MSFAARLLAFALFSSPAFAGTVRVTTADRVSLSAQSEGSGDHGVLVVHDNDQDHTSVAELTKAFGDAQMMVLSLDLRGHGKSSGNADPAASVKDVAAGVAYLRKRGAKQVSIVGVAMGGNLAFNAAAQDAEVTNVVMISPALNHDGVKASTGLEGYGERPILMVVGSDDPLGRKAANLLADRLENATVEVLGANGAGTTLVKRATDLPTMVVTWLSDINDKMAQEQKADLSTENEQLETSGTKLGER